MSPKFLKWFRKKHDKCLNCKSAPIKSRSMCSIHLAKARLGWKKWQEKRKKLGLCGYCDKKRFMGWIRCKAHAIANRIKCLNWAKAHPNRSREYWQERKQKALILGLCVYCRAKPNLMPQTLRCLDCKVKDANYKRGLSRGF